MRTIHSAIAACAVLLGACAYPVGSGDYRYYQRGEQAVSFGVVESVRDVRLGGPDTGVGGASGAAIGMVAGSHAGHGGRYGGGHIAGAIGGAILGGIIGSSVERAANERPGVEVTVQLDSGRYLVIVQEADEQFRSGDRVRVLSGRGAARVTH